MPSSAVGVEARLLGGRLLRRRRGRRKCGASASTIPGISATSFRMCPPKPGASLPPAWARTGDGTQYSTCHLILAPNDPFTSNAGPPAVPAAGPVISGGERRAYGCDEQACRAALNAAKARRRPGAGRGSPRARSCADRGTSGARLCCSLKACFCASVGLLVLLKVSRAAFCCARNSFAAACCCEERLRGGLGHRQRRVERRPGSGQAPAGRASASSPATPSRGWQAASRRAPRL